MWKIALGFVVFAAAALFIMSKGGDIDMSGEKHGIDTTPAHPDVAAAPVAPASAVSMPASSSAKP